MRIIPPTKHAALQPQNSVFSECQPEHQNNNNNNRVHEHSLLEKPLIRDRLDTTIVRRVGATETKTRISEPRLVPLINHQTEPYLCQSHLSYIYIYIYSWGFLGFTYESTNSRHCQGFLIKVFHMFASSKATRSSSPFSSRLT